MQSNTETLKDETTMKKGALEDFQKLSGKSVYSKLLIAIQYSEI